MRSFKLSTTLPLLLATTIDSSMAHKVGGWWGRPTCLDDQAVATLVTGYTYLLEYPGGDEFNSTADAILSEDFVVLSDSILSLSGRDVSVDTNINYYLFLSPPLPTILRGVGKKKKKKKNQLIKSIKK